MQIEKMTLHVGSGLTFNYAYILPYMTVTLEINEVGRNGSIP